LGRSILYEILENNPYIGIHDKFPKEVEEKLPNEESQIANPKPLPSPIQISAIPNLEPRKKEETPILDFMLDFENDLFAENGSTSKYHTTRKPQKISSHKETLDPSKEAFLKEFELTCIVSN